LDFRVFLNPNIEFLALRLTVNTLNKRDYEIGNYMGALKPTIAAAMVQLATNNFSKEAKIVDNFCGSGTILCEAYHKGFNVFGGDINPEAIILTKKRLKMEGCLVTETLKLQDATKTKWNSSYFDCVISNLPWDKQHEVTSITDLYAGCIKEYKRILKSKFRLCIICHKPELLIKHIKKEFGNINIQRLDIGYLGQNPSIVLGTNY
jgi:23S rRNA G2445 N2-methylase RlmL